MAPRARASKPAAKPARKPARKPAAAATRGRPAAAASTRKPRATAKAAPRRRAPAARRVVAIRERNDAPEIMATLNKEHRYIASLLEALAEQADKLVPGATPDYRMLHDIVHYMANFPDEFHHPREDLVFERLVARDAAAGKPVQGLLDGHQEINRRSRELLLALARVTRDGKPADNAKIKALCDRYIGYYWDHINTEEGTVFPLATAKLRQDDWFAITAKSRQVDDPLFGTRVRKEYKRLSDYLGSRVQRAAEDVALAELFGVEALIESVAAIGTTVGEIKDILRRRVRSSLKQSAHAAREGFDEGVIAGVGGLPGAIGGVLRIHLGEGGGEVRASVRRARKEIGEPFGMRMEYLRKLFAENP